MADIKFNLKIIGEGIAGAVAIAVTFLIPIIRPLRLKWAATDAG